VEPSDPVFVDPVFVDDEAGDKYALTDLPEIDCESRYPICQAACCTLRFPLSRQDIDEAVIRWDPVLRYWLAQGEHGYCTHIDIATCRCTVYSQRPGPCRTYDCRDDERIWEDFEARIPNPRLWARTWRRDAALGTKPSPPPA
jgi:Fe-S-cluster containining protein